MSTVLSLLVGVVGLAVALVLAVAVYRIGVYVVARILRERLYKGEGALTVAYAVLGVIFPPLGVVYLVGLTGLLVRGELQNPPTRDELMAQWTN